CSPPWDASPSHAAGVPESGRDLSAIVDTSVATSSRRVRFPRELHPVAWWPWAVGMAACASQTTNPWLLLLLAAVTCLVVVSCRGDGTWARSFKLYLWLAAITVLTRVVFRILLGGSSQGHVILGLPAVPLPEW